MSHGDPVGSLDLTGYDVPHRHLLHFQLAVARNLRQKARKPRGLACELLLPVFFAASLVLGYELSSGDDFAPANYAHNDALNTTEAVDALLCVVGFPEEKYALPHLSRCAGDACPYPVWVPRNESGPKLCARPELADPKEALKRFYGQLISLETNATTIPPLDTMIAMQHVAVHVAGGWLESNDLNYKNSLRYLGNLEFVSPKGCAAPVQLMDHLSNTTKLFEFVLNGSVTRDTPGCPGVWTSEAAAVNYVTHDGCASTWAVVVLNTVDATTETYDFTLRMNTTAVQPTSRVKPYYLNTHNTIDKQYVFSGFTTLETVIGNYYLEDAGAAMQDRFLEMNMPTPRSMPRAFLNTASGFVILSYCVAFIYSVSCLVGGVVEEKEKRLREGMLIMGLSRPAMYASWFCTYALLMFPPCVLMTLVACTTYFKNTSAALVLLFLVTYTLSLTALGLLLTVFFSKARLAALVSPFVVLASTSPGFIFHGNTAAGAKQTASLSSTSCFGFAIELMVQYEVAGTGSGFSEFNKDTYSYGAMLGMLILDLFVYLLLAWYLDHVLPSQYGVKEHPLFIFSPSYWGFCSKRYVSLDERFCPSPKTSPVNVEQDMDEKARSELRGREAVRIMGLRKEFTNAEGHGFTAVDNLGGGVPKGGPGGPNALTFYEGQVQCMLGHNGAGKTTLINMLTGMCQPDAGDCTVWGRSVRDDIDTIRRDIGLCPQHNILWGTLSCEEHLMFYGRIKGVPIEVLKARTTQMLKLVNLYEKKDCWSEVLSGGQKRKLSVACSLIGGSKLVFLDEPTAGMDVESRRAMWHLLRHPSVLQGRVIVLTTHYMEEADILGDSVAIMHKGCLHSWGSPFFLKSRMGAGYNISLAMQKGCNPRRVLDFVQLRMKRVTVEQLSCTGTELVLRVPMDAEPTGESVRLASQTLGIQYDGNPSVFKAAVMRVVESSTSDKKQAACQSVLDSLRSMACFPAMLDELDAASIELRIEGYGVGMTTLEEIFMRIESECDEQELLPSPTASETSLMDHTPLLPEGHKAIDIAKRFGDLYTITDANQPPKSGATLTTDQFRGMLLKRFRCARRDKRALCFQFVLPVLFLLLALLIGSMSAPNNPLLPLTGNVYKDDRDSVLTYSATPSKETLFTADNFPGYVLKNVTAATKGSYVDLSDYLDATMETRWKGDIRGVAIGYTEDTPAVLANMTYFHSMPAGIAGYLNALLQDKQTKEGKKGGSVTVNSHTLPLSFRGKTIADARMRAISSLFISMPFALLPSTFVSFIVKERECKAKHVQMVIGAKRSAYWISSFVFDFAAYSVTMTLAFIIFLAAGRDSLVGDVHVFSATLMLFTSYGVSSILSGYVVSFLFKNHVAAQNATMLLNLAGSIVLVLIVQILHYTSSTEDFADKLTFFCRLVPTYALTDGLTQLSLREMYTTTNALDYVMGPWDLKIAGWDIIFMLLTCPVFVAWIAYLESPEMRARVHSALPFLSRHGETLNNSFIDQNSVDDFDPEMYGKHATDGPSVLFRRGPWLMCRDAAGETYYFNEVTGKSKTSSRETPFYKDPAVQRHAAEVLENPEGRPGDYVTVQRLRKVFPAQGGAAKKVAVCDVSFGVGSGELFAFLGTNGAGKSTTLSMLSSEYEPTSGRAMLAGHDVVLETGLARQHLGFCPQFDALLDNLTCQEHLDLFACLRGVPDEHRAGSADILLSGLGLDAHRNKLASTLSGGNRRKLQVAAALIGGPSAVFLDEPSAGMDPLARRSLWGALEKAITELKLSVILTTHHLEEIEGLSRLRHRVTIMVDGRLQCLGSLRELKQQLGDSFEVTLKLQAAGGEERAIQYFEQRWPSAELMESAQQKLTFGVSKTDASLSRLFEAVEESRTVLGVTDYAIAENSLEQVFMRISERATREEEVQAYDGAQQHLFTPAPPAK